MKRGFVALAALEGLQPGRCSRQKGDSMSSVSGDLDSLAKGPHLEIDEM